MFFLGVLFYFQCKESIFPMFHMQVFFFCGKPAANMSLRLVHIQNLARFRRQCRVDEHESLGDVFMYRGF